MKRAMLAGALMAGITALQAGNVGCGSAVQDDVAAAAQAPVDTRPPNGTSQRPAFEGQTDAPAERSNVSFEVLTVASGLSHPWGMDFLPDGRILVTERDGRLRVVSPGGNLSTPVAGLPAVDARGQGGLLDVALHPDFANNQLIYWTFAERQGGGNGTSVASGRFVDGAAPRVDGAQVIFRQTPTLNSTAHFGGRLVWSRDGTLFVTMGDRSDLAGRRQSQQMNSLIGKIARIHDDGRPPADNPYAGRAGVPQQMFSIGHRNVQAAALHPETGELWEVEHGTRGGDELNVVRGGQDYGWPTIAYGVEYSGAPINSGITQRPGMEQPLYYWDPVIAPSGMAFYTGDLFPAWQGSLFIGGLGTEDLVRLSLDGERIVGEERLLRDVSERIRDVVQGPDGALYLLTDSARGRILKLVPSRAVAVTFDDLPGRGDLPRLRAATAKLLGTLTTERVPATGFVNELNVVSGGAAERTAVLASWLDAGFDLGNHTYSHIAIDRVPFEAYRADLIRGETVTRGLLEARGRRLRYFRHTHLRTGPTPEYKAALDGLLAERGYRVAAVTIDNNEFMFAAVYERARLRGDHDTMARVAAAYVPYMERVFEHFEDLSREFLGYEVPQVFLLHANELNSDLLPDLIRMIRARGYRFVSLDEALEDSAYRLPDAQTALGVSWLHRWMLAKGLPMQPEPAEPQFVRDLYNATSRWAAGL